MQSGTENALRSFVTKFVVRSIIYLILQPICYPEPRFCDAVFVLQNLCEACMLHSSAVMRALRWLAEICSTGNVKQIIAVSLLVAGVFAPLTCIVKELSSAVRSSYSSVLAEVAASTHKSRDYDTFLQNVTTAIAQARAVSE